MPRITDSENKIEIANTTVTIHHHLNRNHNHQQPKRTDTTVSYTKHPPPHSYVVYTQGSSLGRTHDHERFLNTIDETHSISQ